MVDVLSVGRPSEVQGVTCPITDDVNLDHVVKGNATQNKKSLKSVNRKDKQVHGVLSGEQSLLSFQVLTGVQVTEFNRRNSSLLLAPWPSVCEAAFSLSGWRFIDCVTVHDGMQQISPCHLH